MYGGRGLGLDIMCWRGKWISEGSHSLQCRMLIARLAKVSEMHPHSPGQGLPPNVSLRAAKRRVIPLIHTWVKDLTAVFALRCWRR